MNFSATLLVSFNSCYSLSPRTQKRDSNLSLRADAMFRDMPELKNFE